VSFEERLESLDVELLGRIHTGLTPEDRRSLLALHLACRRTNPAFRWLEIGSHLGGSLQALVRDPGCIKIDSIDSRPEQIPDERIATVAYPGNSTARMLRLLSDLPDADMRKVRTHDIGTDQLDPQAFQPPDVCFIDAEHTDEACARDAEFCRNVLREDGVIAFHDIFVVYRAVAAFVEALALTGTPHGLAYLPDNIFAVELGRGQLLSDHAVIGRQVLAGAGLLWGLRWNDRYRAVLKGRRARLLRRLGLLRYEEPTIVRPGPQDGHTLAHSS
jgi:predicted O-methyltransferase YrrM